MEPEDPALSIAARHALHDEELVVAFATDGDAADDAARARGFVERCPACRELYDDVGTIGGALQAMRSEARATERAPRSFAVSAEDAARLRPDVPVRKAPAVPKLRERIMAALRSIGRPVGMSMAAVGVAGVLLGTVTLGGGAALAPVPEDAGTTSGGAVASSVPRSTVQAVPGSTLAAGEVTGTTATPGATERLELATSGPLPDSTGGSATGDGNASRLLVVGGSLVLLGAGIGLLMLGSRRKEPNVGG
jgi:hypothetical protein